MTDSEVAIVGEGQHPLTANAMVARVRLIQQVMGAVMKDGTHYGTIPGCPKPSLWKPGAEQLLVAFKIAPDEPKVEDLSTDDSIRYRVTRVGKANNGTVLVAAGVGECSSSEEKYMWRRPVSEAEYDATPEDRRRLKYRREGTDKQVRTNPADVANTILKMADKRAFVAMALLATAASDCFSQDLEDLPAEIVESIEGQQAPAKPKAEPPKPKAAAQSKDIQVKKVTVSKVTTRTVKGRDGDSTVWDIVASDGQKYGTFVERFANVAVDVEGTSTEVEIGFTTKEWSPGKFNHTVQAIRAMPQAAEA